MMPTELFSVGFCATILCYACYSDLKTRTVSNKLWLLLLAVGLPLALYNGYRSGVPFLIGLGYSIGFTTLLAYLFFYLNLFGGADAKALMGIALLIPTNPLFAAPIPDPFPFAITTLFNGAMLSVLVFPLMFLYNVVKLPPSELRAHLGLAFVGYKRSIDTLASAKRTFQRLLHSYELDEESGGETVRRAFVIRGLEIDEDAIHELKTYHEQGKIGDAVWVTPGLPYMLFITAGFFFAFFAGNLPFRIILAFLSSL
ncbi:MAG TPA: A24 family peptidase [Methanomicrobia archaeon]|nr:A24 family peptidase [Methanomicrobia archaeon]